MSRNIQQENWKGPKEKDRGAHFEWLFLRMMETACKMGELGQCMSQHKEALWSRKWDSP